MYLKSKNIVSEITKNFDFITIDNNNLSIRPLLMRATKYYLNKVCPSIPSSIIHDKIMQLGINITSLIQRERMNNDDNDFAHVYSFRRTFYGILENNITIPDSFIIKHENENYRIYISNEIKRCTHCLKIGHLIDVCKQLENENNHHELVDINDNVEIAQTQQFQCMNIDLNLSSSSLNTENNEIEMVELNEDHDNVNEKNTFAYKKVITAGNTKCSGNTKRSNTIWNKS